MLRLALTLLLAVALLAPSARSTPALPFRIDHVTDGDTVVLTNGAKVRLVQIDTPEVYFGTECYGPQASATTERLLPVGTRVHLQAELATDRVDDYGRLLRYVIRAKDNLNVNIRLVAIGAAAPYFYEGRRGRYANRLEALAKRAKAKKSDCGVRAREHRTTLTAASRRSGDRLRDHRRPLERRPPAR